MVTKGRRRKEDYTNKGEREERKEMKRRKRKRKYTKHSGDNCHFER